MIRFLPWFTAVVASILFGIAAARNSALGWGLLVTLPLALVGFHDWLQQRHTLTRNYPMVGHLRWMLEAIGPHLRQYFFDDDLQGAPYNREQKSVVYARAKGDNDFEPFGTEKNVLIKEIQTDPLKDSLYHADFLEIDLDKPARFNVPLTYAGKAKGEEFGGLKQIEKRSIVLEGKPLTIPDSCQINISGLAIGEKITAGQISLPDGVSLVSNPDMVCISVIAP